MDATLARRSYIGFCLVLGLGLLALSIQTLLHALMPENRHTHQHFAMIAVVEGLAAILFLLPRVSRAGALLLVITIGGGFVAHAAQGEWRADLAIYAAGAWFAFARGGAWQGRESGASAGG